MSSCPKCGAAVEAGAVFCTGCGARLAEAAALASVAQSARPESAQSSSTQSPSAEMMSSATAGVAAQPAIVAQSPIAAPVAEQPAFAASAQPVSQSMSQPELGGAPAGRRIGPIVLVVLLLVIVGAAGLLWLWPSTNSSSSGGTTISSGSKVLILTPELSTITVEPNATASVGVAVQGDGGAGVTWKVAENYGGSVQAAGVTLQGSRVIYKATYRSGGTPGDYHVLATSQANKDVRVTITVHVER